MICDEQNTQVKKLAHILIVEDESMVSNLLKEILTPNYTVSTAGTVKSALEKSYTEIPDLILCDIKLPDGSGLKILETLKLDESTAHIPILVISQLDTEEDVIAGLELGADDYIPKPFSNSELLARIKTRLNNCCRIINWCRNTLFTNKASISSNLPSKEQQFVDKLNAVSESLIKSGDLTSDTLAREMAYSKRQLQRKIKEHLNSSCSDYIFSLRMSYAESLNEKGYTSKEITALIGYKDVAHFSRIFKKYMENRERGSSNE